MRTSSSTRLRAGSALLTLVLATPAAGQGITFTPMQDARLRYEHVDQDGIARQADALTLRVRSGATIAAGPISVLVEAQGNIALVDRYDDSVGHGAGYPVVGDPENIALYRAQLQYKAGAVAFTSGRQKIVLDDERFVGAANFRQNARTFDAARLQWSVTPTTKADLSYAWSVRSPVGINGRGAKPTAIGGDNVFINIAQATPAGTLTGFAYLIDQDEAAVQGYRLANQSYGARLTGGKGFAPGWKANWQLSYATQSDYHRNPNRYKAEYYLIDLGVEGRAWRLGGGYEVLGAGNGTALTSFQTPLASIFKFQGWADKLTTTPPDGLRDLYGNVGLAWKTLGPLKATSVQVVFHRFEAERVTRHYGDEIDLLASTKWKSYSVSARYADYRADAFATDTRKVWLEFGWAI